MKFLMKAVALVSLLATTAVLSFAAGRTFPDVDQNAYYADAISKVADKGLITGYKDGKFGPNDPVTRGQMAVIMDRFESYMKNGEVPAEKEETKSEEPKTDEKEETKTEVKEDENSVVATDLELVYHLGTAADNTTNSFAECEKSDWSGKDTDVKFNYKNMSANSPIVRFVAYYGPEYALAAKHQLFIGQNTAKDVEINLPEGCFQHVYVEALDEQTGEVMDRMFAGEAAKLSFETPEEPTVTQGVIYYADGKLTNSFETCKDSSDKEKQTLVYFDYMNTLDTAAIFEYKVYFGEGRVDFVAETGNNLYKSSIDRQNIALPEGSCYDKVEVDVVRKENQTLMETIKIAD